MTNNLNELNSKKKDLERVLGEFKLSGRTRAIAKSKLDFISSRIDALVEKEKFDVLEKMGALEDASGNQHIITFMSNGTGYVVNTISWKRIEFKTLQEAREKMGREVFKIKNSKSRNNG